MKIKYVLYIPIAVVIFTIVGFIVRPEHNKQPISDVVWGIYSPILTLIGLILVFLAIIWVIRQVAKLHVGNNANNVVSFMGKTFSRACSVIPIALGWLIFIATILYLHPQLWSAWYGNQPLFWISQAIFMLLLVAFHNYKEVFYLLITTAVVVSFWYGFSDRLKEGGVITKTPENVSSSITHGIWRICWEDPKRPSAFNSERKEAPCAPGPNVGRFVKIKEYNSARFVFTVSWKEHGVTKERALFVWDKIANPKYGTWHQLGSEDENHGTWRLVLRDNIFVGWRISTTPKAKYATTMDRWR